MHQNLRLRRTPDWTALPAPDPRLEVSVIVPVRNEARRLRAALRCLAGQRDASGGPLDPGRFEVIVLANNCTDASAEIVREFAVRKPELRLYVVEVAFPSSVAHVGHARACLMNEACRRLTRRGHPGGVIASTDGDTRVAPDWLSATLAEVHAGADAVGGRIVMDATRADPPGLALYTRRDADYQRLRAQLEDALDPDPADPWPRHHQHFGASLAITTHAYRRVGGLPAEPFLEDEALFEEMRRHDIKVRHSERVAVLTSSRRHGRVEVGLSWQLREWATLAKAGRQATVTDPVAWANDIVLRRRLRRLWMSRRAPDGRLSVLTVQRLKNLATKLDVPERWLERRVGAGEPFGAIWSDVQAHRKPRAEQAPHVGMGQAITALRAMLARHRQKTRARADRAGRSRAASRSRA